MESLSNLPVSFVLNNGYHVPSIGLGTFQGDDGSADVESIVLEALKLGYRHIDTARAYGNEREVGEAIAKCGIPRAELFITTKLAQTWHDPADVAEALDTSLRVLQLDYVDLFLMHFPQAYVAGVNHATIRHPSGNGKPLVDHNLSRRYTETWLAMEKLVASGKARSIGLSNFNILKTKRILEVATIVPAVNQVEMHPYLPQQDLLDFSANHGILIMAHQPLGGRPAATVRAHADRAPPTEDAEIIKISETAGMSPAQACLSWAVQRGVAIVPKSARTAHLQQNLNLKSLPDNLFRAVEDVSCTNGPLRFLDPRLHLGFDIFDEAHDQPLEDELTSI